MMRELVSKEMHKKLPQAGRVRVGWHWFWFSWFWGDIKRRKLWRGSFYLNTRIANAREVSIGPVYIMIPCRWLAGPARQLHPEIYNSET